jgi:CDP-4-dehydro-6-deoxyglucose reductase
LGIASCPCDDRNLQFHLHRGENFADKALELHPNDYVDLVAPQGSFVLRDDSPRSLLFVAFGGGFARIKSLVEHAMSLDAAESMHLYWVATADTGHYLHNLCRSWDDALDDFHYRPVAADAALDPAKLAGDIATRQREFLDFDVFVCGPRELAEPLAAVMRDRGLPENQLRVEFSER